MNKLNDTIKHLIIVNVIFFIAVKLLGYNLYDNLALWFPESENFKFWQVFTHMFMHSQTFYLHIIMNMFGLWMFGTPLEQMWGRKKFLFFYLSAGLGAVILPLLIDYYQFNEAFSNLIQSGVSESEINNLIYVKLDYDKTYSDNNLSKMYSILNTASVGASGCIMGLVAAFGINFPNAKMALIFLPVPVAAKYFIPVLLTYEILSGIFGWSSIFGVNIAHFAHLGGAIIGGIIAYYWKKNQFKIN